VVRLVVGLIIVLHGLVHLLYFGQSARLFELAPGMTWPDGSWVFSTILGDNTTRWLANITCILVAICFITGSVGIYLGQPWWRTALLASAVFSGVVFILFWNGRLQQLDKQGGVGILIDAMILVSVLVFRWPRFDF